MKINRKRLVLHKETIHPLTLERSRGGAASETLCSFASCETSCAGTCSDGCTTIHCPIHKDPNTGSFMGCA